MNTSALLRCCIAAIALAAIVPCHAGELKPDATPGLRKLKTRSGIGFGLLGAKRSIPAPTLFAFSGTMEQALETVTGNPYINPKGGQVLAEQGFIFVLMDLPCHGQDWKQGQPKDGLGCWAWLLERGDFFVPDFLARLSSVLDYLIQEGYSDPAQIGAWGLSRGGFIALHFAAADPRVRWVAVFAPVTDLVVLNEFKNKMASKALALTAIADKLTRIPLWLWIGDNDVRVGTDQAIALTRRVVEAASLQGKPAEVELHVVPADIGSALNGHTVAPGAYEEAANWILIQTRKGKRK